MVSPIVAVSLMMGLLGLQTVIALSMFPQDALPNGRETRWEPHTPTPTVPTIPEGAPVLAEEAECREILPDVIYCPLGHPLRRTA